MTRIMVPSRNIELAGGLRCGAREVPVDVWQAHLVKHPLGVNAVRNGARWDHEEWDKTTPPVTTDVARTELITRIHNLPADYGKCGVREFRGSRTPTAAQEPCEYCKPPLLSKCGDLFNKDGLSERYASVTEGLLDEMGPSRATPVPRIELTQRLTSNLGQKSSCLTDAAVVLVVGRGGPDRLPMVTIRRADGTHAEFWLHHEDLRWRTTYRIPLVSVNTRISFFLRTLRTDASLPLSDQYLVSRGWWDSYGH